jgi:hypothetical protein
MLTIYRAGATAGTVVDDGSLTQQGSLVTWSPDGRWIVVTSTRDGLIVFDASIEGFPAQTFRAPGENGHYRALAFDGDGRLIAQHFPACDALGEGTGPPCDTRVEAVLVLDPASGEVLDTLDVVTDDQVVDLAPTGEAILVTTVYDYDPLAMRLRWYGGGRTGTVPGPYGFVAEWAPARGG